MSTDSSFEAMFALRSRAFVDSTPTAPTGFLIHFTGFARNARQQKAALRAGQRRRANKTRGTGVKPTQSLDGSGVTAGDFSCCSLLSVPKLFGTPFHDF